MRRWGILIVAALIAVLTWWAWPSDGAPEPGAGSRDETRAGAVSQPPTRTGSEAPMSSGRDPSRRAAADRLRVQIAAALRTANETRGQAASGGGLHSTNSDPAQQPTEGTSGLTDRVGLDPETGQALHAQLMPLADECIAQARERDESLSGMLAMEFGVAGDPDLGAVVDAVGFPDDRNEVHEEELLTCMRETALSMTLPAPENGGRLDLMITIPVE